MRTLLILFVLGFFYNPINAQMVLSGSATGSCDCYDITNGPNQAGSIWSPATINLTNSFDFTFSVNLGVDDTWGADGMMFALRQSGTSTGALGNGLGFSGILNSIGVEIDTWNSSPTVSTDIASDHLAMSSNGTVNHNLIAPIGVVNVEDGAFHDFRITWDPAFLDLEVYLDGISVFVYTGDMVALFFGGNPNVYFGITGGTGGVDNDQSVCMYRDANFTADYLTACIGQEVSFTDISTSDLIYNLDAATTWDWDFGDGGSSSLENPTHSYATAGFKTVTLIITDVSGCSSTETLIVEITPALELTMSHTDITCFGDDDGTGTAVPTTGIGPYSYLWDDALLQTSSTSTGLTAGVFTVTVTDDVGCVGTGTVTIVEPPLLVIDSSTPTNASCGLSNGTISIVASGGSPGLQYSIDGGGSFTPAPNFIGLINATYNVVVRDVNGCTATTTTIVGIDSPLIIDSVTGTDVSCGPDDDGTITVIASAGVAPFQYSIDGITFQLSNFFDLLASGTYTVTVLDDAGCSVTQDIVIGSLSTIIVDLVTVTDVLCNGGSTGRIEISVSGGTPAYTYSIDGGSSFSPTSLFVGLSAGSYDLAVEDAVGCTVTSSTVIAEPSIITIDLVAPTDVTCNGLADGEFVLTVSGGTPGYTYSNDGGGSYQISPTFTGMVAGDYDLEIKDANNCIITGLATVNEPAVLVLDDIIVVDVTCNGLADGEVTAVVSGGTGPYQYRIDGGAYQISPNFTGLSGGAVIVEILDANGCTTTGDAFLDEAEPLVLTLGADTTICLGGAALLCPTLIGGTAPYTYTWDGVPTAIACLTTTDILTHTLQVADVNGCTSEIEELLVDLYTPVSVLATGSISICPGEDVVLAGEASGDGPSGYEYEWTNDLDATVLLGPVQDINPEMTIVYTLTVNTGCENTAVATVTVTTYPVPAIVFNSDIYSGCEDLKVNLMSLSDPTLVASTSWDFGDGITGVGSSVSHTYVEADCYDIKVGIVTIDNCPVSATFVDTICVWKIPVADFSYTPDQPDLFNTTVDFYNESEYASSFLWTFGDDTGSAGNSPDHTYPEYGNKTYKVQLVAISDKGCRDSTFQLITIDEIVLYYIPNAFTPNADPFNQNFYPVFIPGFYPTDFHFVIFNRWGEIVWESYDQTAAWDGTYDNVIVEQGVYTWELTFRENRSDKKYRDFGHITVLK